MTCLPPYPEPGQRVVLRKHWADSDPAGTTPATVMRLMPDDRLTAEVVHDDGQWTAHRLSHLERVLDGAQVIASARRHQVEGEGYPVAHDLEHAADGQLVAAAWCYLGDLFAPDVARLAGEPPEWPWPGGEGGCQWKPTPDDPVKQLAKAGAMIAAEIDRRLAAG